jgi:DNA-directed RNA polymerase specialized sigma24 family protein
MPDGLADTARNFFSVSAGRFPVAYVGSQSAGIKMRNQPPIKKAVSPVPEDRAATAAEIEDAVNKLSDADWYRLRSCADRLEFLLQEKAMGRDLLGEAFERLLRGSRKWDKTKSGLVTFLFGAMRSICNAWFRAKKSPTERPILATSLTVEDEEGHLSDPVSKHPALDPTAEELVIFREALTRIDDVLKDDQEARMIVEGFRDGLEPSGIRKLWGFSQPQYETIVTRMRRKIKRAGILQPQQGVTNVQ